MKIGRIAILFGAGAVEFSWSPILRIIEPFCRYHPATDDVANTFFAGIVYQLRMATRNHDNKDYDELLGFYKSLKQSICQEIESSMKKNEIVIKSEFIETLNILKKHGTEYRAITTNWDAAADKYFEDNVIHLHGIFSDPHTLYLPTEIIDEEYRPEVQRENHLLSHGKALQALSEADTLLIYGLSLSPLDAELSNLLSECLNGEKISYILFIDPDFDKVIKRMQFYIQKTNPNVKMIGVSPGEIHKLDKLLSL
jgi:hypothetical protein